LPIFSAISLSISKTCQNIYCFSMPYKGACKNNGFVFWLARYHPPIFALPKITIAKNIVTKGNSEEDGPSVFIE
jgi:hypothetical protein